MAPSLARAAGWPPLLKAGAALSAVLLAVALAAPWLAPHDPAAQDDPAVARYRPPGTRLFEVRLADGRLWLADRATPTAAGLTIERGGVEVELPSSELATPGARPRSRRYLLGTDGFGRDVLSRLLLGSRTSLVLGGLAGLLALTLGVAVGGAAGIAGGIVDGVLMRGVEGLLAFPRLFLVIAVAALTDASSGVLILVLGATGWMSTARLVRGQILRVERREFVEAARALGAGPGRVLVRHLLPHALTPAIVDTALRIGNLILVEAALSFLGLGVREPTPSWGGMIAQGADALTSAWWVAAFPGLAIAATVLALNLVADGLRDRLDPRHEPVA